MITYTQSKLKDFDLKSVVEITKPQLSITLANTAIRLKEEWVARASSELAGTVGEYVRGIEIGIPVVGSGIDADISISISLDGLVANMIEQGLGPQGVGSTGPFDMRKFILKNRQYANVPFRFVGIAAATGGAELVAHTMRPIAVGQVALKAMGLTGRQRLPAGLVAKLREHPNTIYDPLTGEAHIQRAHKTDPIAGLHGRGTSAWGVTAGAGRQTSREFTAFRGISWRAKPWIHPGIRPRNLAKKLNIFDAFNTAFAEF